MSDTHSVANTHLPVAWSCKLLPVHRTTAKGSSGTLFAFIAASNRIRGAYGASGLPPEAQVPGRLPGHLTQIKWLGGAIDAARRIHNVRRIVRQQNAQAGL